MSFYLLQSQISSLSNFDNDEILGGIANSEPPEGFPNVVVRTQGEDDFGVYIARFETIMQQVIDGSKCGGQDLLS